MIDKAGRILLLAATALTVVAASGFAEPQAETNDCLFTTVELLNPSSGYQKAKRTFQGRFECGFVKVQTDSIHDMKRDKLRLSKATFKTRMTVGNFPMHYKVLKVHDLRPCSLSTLSNVAQIDAEVLSKLDCQDLKTFFPGENVPSYLNDYSAPQQTYVKRSAYRLTHGEQKLDLHLYPLKESEVQSHIDKFVQDNEQLAGSLDFIPGYKIFGHHFEFYVHNTRDGSRLLSVSGIYYVAGNSTEVFNWHADPFVTYSINLGVLIKDLYRNSFIFDMPNFKIVSPVSPLQINMSLSMFMQEKFPFLWVKHRITDTLPQEMNLLTSLVDYHSTVNQTQDPSDQSKYQSNVFISSGSLLPELNFRLEQVIKNIDNFTGSEEMFFASTTRAIAVKANWAKELYRKSISLFHANTKDLKTQIDIIKEPDDDYMHLNFKFKKSSVIEYTDVLLKSITQAPDVKEEIKYVNEDL